MARLALILLLALAPTSASAAQIAVDVDRGTVLLADDADAVRRPASIVKLMTAYIAFAALEAGDVTDEDPVTVSKHAARQPPVKLRVRAGQTLPFGELLAAAIIGSRNDAATAVAEAVAGSEGAFVERMNAAATRLGMTNTRYANASGLPTPGQRTTARDTALLALALLTDYPERSQLFSERKTRAGGKGVTTTNPLFGRVPGAQGMKTGFTCGAGYNIAGLVERDGRRVLAVTLGHKTKGGRLTAIKALIGKGFDALGSGSPLETGVAVPQAPPHIGACSGKAIAKAKESDAWIPPERPKPVRPAPVMTRRVVVLPKPAPPPPRTIVRKPPPPPPLSGWAAFLGAFSSEQEASARLAAVNALATKARTLPVKIFPRPRDGRRLGVIYGLTQPQARAICTLAKGIGQYCLTLGPKTLLNPKARWRR